jgi:hypothetical protein
MARMTNHHNTHQKKNVQWSISTRGPKDIQSSR